MSSDNHPPNLVAEAREQGRPLSDIRQWLAKQLVLWGYEVAPQEHFDILQQWEIEQMADELDLELTDQ